MGRELGRRGFLRRAGAGALAAAGVGADPRRASGDGGGIAPTRAPDPEPLDDVAGATVAELQAALASGALTAVRIAHRLLERIDRLDRRGPGLHAVIELNPDALDIAARCDAERRAGRPAGPLHGIPVLVKDNIDTGDRIQTSAGSLAGTHPAAFPALAGHAGRACGERLTAASGTRFGGTGRYAGALSTALHPDLLADLARTAARALGIRLVVLFGSTSRGQARPDSDVDIGVLGGGFWDQLRLGSELSLALRREPHVVDLAEASDWLRFEAARDGIPIYEREPRAWSDFKAEAMLAYFDLAPIISICVEGTRRRLLADARAGNRG